jgi:penicillin-binding protein 1A
VIYRPEREAPPEQVLSPRVVADMNFMLSKVPEEGTGKRGALDGIRSAGKTGTTNAYRDAWYVGFTGNLVAGVWFGNDDHTSTNNMTGGTLPAMTWKEVMAFAHQNLEIRPIPGLGPDGSIAVAAAGRGQNPAQGGAAAGANAPAQTPGMLSRRSFEVIGGITELLRKAEPSPPGFTAVAPPLRAEAPSATGAVAAPRAERVAMP